jgi:uncharacterized cupredoxin-like copper-binding protein
MRVARFSVLAVAVLVVAVSGCGSDDEGGSTGGGGGATTAEAAKPSGEAATTVDVSATEFKFDPANPKIEKAGVVAFKVTNDGQTVHALEVEGPKGEVETSTIEPGKSETLKADLSKAGSYEWYCPVGNHREQGMEGTVSVAGGGSGGSTTEDSTTEDSTTEDSDDSGGGGGAGGY